MEIVTGGNSHSFLQLIQKKSPPDLIISNHGEEYGCHFNVISMFSKKIALLSGPNRPKTIVLETKTKLHFLQDVINFFYGHPIVLDFTNYNEILILADYFNSDYLKSITTQASTFFEFSQSLLTEPNFSDFTQKEVDFFAFFFQAFSNNEIFNNFPFEIIQKVLKSDKMTLINEDYLIHWILQKYRDVKMRRKLLKFVVIEKVSSNGFKEIFSSLKNLDEIGDKIKIEFIKDPRKRNLSLERNPRYFESSDELNERILNFELSTVFTFNISGPLKEGQKHEQEAEPKSNLEGEKTTKTKTNSISVFDQKQKKNEEEISDNFSEETFSVPQKSPHVQLVSKSNSSSQYQSDNSPQKTHIFSPQKTLDSTSPPPQKNSPNSMNISPSSDRKRQLTLFEMQSMSFKKEKNDKKHFNFETPKRDTKLFDMPLDEALSKASITKNKLHFELDDSEPSISSSDTEVSQDDEEEEEAEKGQRSMKHMFNNDEVKARIHYESSETESDTEFHQQNNDNKSPYKRNKMVLPESK